MLNSEIVRQDYGIAYKPGTRSFERVVEALVWSRHAVRDSENIDREGIRDCSWESLRALEKQVQTASVHDELDAGKTTL